MIEIVKLFPAACPVCASADCLYLARRFDGADIVRCVRCGHAYLKSKKAYNEIRKDNYASYYISDKGESEASVVQKINGWFGDSRGPYHYSLDFLSKNAGLKNKSVLEIGCGIGVFLRECLRRGASVTGIDPSSSAATLAKKYFNLDITMDNLEGAFEKGLLPEKGFDFIFAFEVIEHVPRPTEFLNTIFGLLKTGGLVFISSPNFYLFHTMKEHTPALLDYTEHLHYFEPLTLAACAERAGFAVLKCTTVSPLAYGERVKMIFKNKLLDWMWRKIRFFGPLYRLKDYFFHFLDRRKELADQKGWNGRNIICILSKPG